MPTIRMTTRSSMSVKPCSSSRSLRSIHVLLGRELPAGSPLASGCGSPATSVARPSALRPALTGGLPLASGGDGFDYARVIDVPSWGLDPIGGAWTYVRLPVAVD